MSAPAPQPVICASPARKSYVWYGASGRAVARGRLVQVVPHLDGVPGATYWRPDEDVKSITSR